ncbi:MAG: TetR/AcrR family transcriptional regulator [Gemmatimonadota bacterium]|jgi:AcrR family transcriptional regulator
MSGSYHHGDLREALLAAAFRVLDAESLQAVTLRRLAREAGVSHAAPYHHFPDLDSLLAAVAARGFDKLREAMTTRTAEAGADPFRRLQAAGTAYVAFAVTRPELFRLMFSGRWRDMAGHPGLESAERRAFGALEGLIVGARGRGRSESQTVRVAARAAWAMVHGVATLLVDGRMDTPPGEDRLASAEQLTREVTAVLGLGLRSLEVRAHG